MLLLKENGIAAITRGFDSGKINMNFPRSNGTYK